MTAPGIKTTNLTLTRTISASPEDVFDVWLNPQSAGSPFHGVTKAIVNPVVDGLFYSMYQMEGAEIAHYGRFVTLDRGTLIRQTWVSELTRGLESLITIRLEAQGGKTLVTLVHSNVPDDDGGHRHEQAWGYVLGAMMKRFSK